MKRVEEKQLRDKEKILEKFPKPAVVPTVAGTTSKPLARGAASSSVQTKPKVAESTGLPTPSFRYPAEVSDRRKDRNRGDIIISANGIVRNCEQQVKTYPMNTKPVFEYYDIYSEATYNFKDDFDSKTAEQQTEFLSKNTIEIVYAVQYDEPGNGKIGGENEQTSLDVLKSLGPTFITRAKKIVLKIVCPELDNGPESSGVPSVDGPQVERKLNHKNWGPEPYPVDPTSRNYIAIDELRVYLNTCVINPDFLKVILVVPPTPTDLPEIFLDHVFLLVPLYRLNFTKWTAKYHVSDSRGPLIFVSRWALDHCRDEYNRVLVKLDNLAK